MALYKLFVGLFPKRTITVLYRNFFIATYKKAMKNKTKTNLFLDYKHIIYQYPIQVKWRFV